MPDSNEQAHGSGAETPNLDDSIRFDPFLRVSGEILLVMEGMVPEVVRRHHEEGARPSTEVKIRACLEALVANLIVAEGCSRDTFLAVPMSAAALSVRGQEQYSRHGLGYDNFKKVVDYFKEGPEPLVQPWRGFWDPTTQIGRYTRLKGTPRLWSLLRSTDQGEATEPPLVNVVTHSPTKPVIKVRDEHKEEVAFTETPEVTSMAERSLAWNLFLQRQWVDLRLTDQEFAAGFSQFHEDDDEEEFEGDKFKPLHLDLSRNWLYRIFRPGFELHGRFYGGWWQEIPSQFRNRITINWYPCTEVDFSEMQAHMLYAMVGQQPPDQCYRIEEAPQIPRDVVKKAFFKIINALEGQQVRAADPASLPDGLTWSDLLGLLRRKHAPIAQYFNTGIGLSLMRKDSEIADIVMQSLMRRNILALPVHDSFLIRQAYVHRLKDEMTSAYRQVMGEDISVTVEPPFRDTTEGPGRPISTFEDATRIFQGAEDDELIDSPYRSYYLRRQQVRSTMPREYFERFNPR